MSIKAELLEILVCPLHKSVLQYDTQNDELISVEAGLAYPIRDQIPIMLADQSRHLDSQEIKKWRRKKTPSIKTNPSV